MNTTFENSVTGRLLSSVSDANSLVEESEMNKTSFIYLNRSTIAYWPMGDTVHFAVSTRKNLDDPDPEIGELWAYEQLRDGNYSIMAREDFVDLFGLCQ